MQKVAIQGLGFVGSAMAVAIASKKNKDNKNLFLVTGVDLPSKEGIKRIDSINNGKPHFHTDDNKLKEELYKSVKETKNLSATSSCDAYKDAQVILVSINCDLKQSKRKDKIEIENFKRSLEPIAQNISEETLIIIESTVPPGTTEKVVLPLFQKITSERNIKKFYLAHSYERVMPGNKYLDSIINYWRVYAGVNVESAKRCENFLKAVINTEDYPLTEVKNTIASETAKLMENSYRAVNIAFIEEWSRFAESAGFDIYEIIEAIRLRPTHSNMRQPGFGVGGYCLTKDPLFGKIGAKDILKLDGHDFIFSSTAISINNEMPLVSYDKIKKYFSGSLNKKRILLLGITYREGVEDTRFSPSEIFVKKCQSENIEIEVYDPLVRYWDELELDISDELPEGKK